MDGRLGPLLDSPAAPALAGIALAMAGFYVAGRRGRARWAGLALRLLAVAGFVIPGWTIMRWFRSLAGMRDAAASLPIDPQPIMESFMASSAILLAAGFALLVGGVHLARKLGAAQGRGR